MEADELYQGKRENPMPSKSRRGLHRYLAEFEFRYNHRSALGVNDNERAAAALKGIEGKRLTYRRTGEAANA